MGTQLPAGYKPLESEPFMNERQREYFRRKLNSWKDEILRESRETIQNLQAETIPHADLADRASTEAERQLELRTRDRQRKLIAKIDAALRRLEDGSYGFCEETGEPISLKRLDARPIATLSHRGAGAPRAPRKSLSRRLARNRDIRKRKTAGPERIRPFASAPSAPFWRGYSLDPGLVAPSRTITPLGDQNGIRMSKSCEP